MLHLSEEKIRRRKSKIGESPTRKASRDAKMGSSRKTKIKGRRENKRSSRKVTLLCDVELEKSCKLIIAVRLIETIE